eukprot:1010304_1
MDMMNMKLWINITVLSLLLVSCCIAHQNGGFMSNRIWILAHLTAVGGLVSSINQCLTMKNVIFLGMVMMSEMKCISALSICKEVDTVFVVHSNVIIEDGEDHSTVMQDFIEEVIYDASSEKSGIGFVIYDHLPSEFNPNNITDLQLLGLKETKHLSVKKTSKAVEEALDFSSFFTEDVPTNDNVATLSTALKSAHDLFERESKVEDDAILIFSFDHSTRDFCVNYYNSDAFDEDVEKLYFVEVELNSDGDIEIDAVYHCHNGSESQIYDAWNDLREITCPSDVDLG